MAKDTKSTRQARKAELHQSRRAQPRGRPNFDLGVHTRRDPPEPKKDRLQCRAAPRLKTTPTPKFRQNRQCLAIGTRWLHRVRGVLEAPAPGHTCVTLGLQPNIKERKRRLDRQLLG